MKAILILLGMVILMSLDSNVSAADAPMANLAVVAKVSTSFVSGHETLEAINDGNTPRASDDTTHGAYGNWPEHGTQWVEYTWPAAVSVNKVDIFWYDDNRGVRVPAACRLKYWNDNQWSDVVDAQGLGLTKNQFNTTTFKDITTSRLRLEMDGNGQSSTGVIEWRVYDNGQSPAFPSIVTAGPDRVVVQGGKTYLAGHVKSTGKPGFVDTIAWSKKSGPGDVTFADARELQTTATFSALGDYVLELTSQAGELRSNDTLKVHVEPAPKVADLTPLEIRPYKLDSAFWEPRVKGLIVNWIPHCIAENEKPDLKEGGINNLIEAGKKLDGQPFKKHIGYPFSNAWVLNTAEAMCDAQLIDAKGDAEILAAQKMMRDKLEEWIPIILAAQEPDGYFQTRFTLGSGREGDDMIKHRWDPRYRGEHEGYVAGYFIEMGIAHYISTGGKDLRLYNAAKKLADCWCDHIGPGKKAWFDGHQVMEMALFRLGRFVDENEGAGKGKKYMELAKFLLDNRAGGGMYDQSHLPVVQQYAAVGHAVRAVYNYSGMADVAMEMHDHDYQSAVLSLWSNLIDRKYYITGGIGSGETSEGFGKDYSLPNNAYCESCSGSGMLFFQHRMNLAFAQSKYVDIYEDTIYNAILSDVDLEGQNFTYTNALDTDEKRYKWHVCPCCVGNIPRTLLSLPVWTYAKSEDGIYVNMFVGGTTTVDKVAGTDVELVQNTEYPWKGAVAITVNPKESRKFALRIRVPDRGVSKLYTTTPAVSGLKSVSVNGEAIKPAIEDGYVVITRDWKAGDKVAFEVPLEVQRVRADERVVNNRGRVALRYGPLLFNIEAVDQKLDHVLSPEAPIEARFTPDLLGGVMTLRGQYTDGSPLLAIPNYARNNRGGRSIVWIREK